MNLSDKWIKKAKQRTGIKGEHAYLEALRDVVKEIDKEIEEVEKKYKEWGYRSSYIKLEILKDFKLKLFINMKKIRKYKLIKEYPYSLKLGYIAEIHDDVKERLNTFNEFWQEVIEKDYEILSFRVDTTIYKLIDGLYDNSFGFKHPLNVMIHYLTADRNPTHIHSVKRLSDGEIFTIGDKINDGEILNFSLSKVNDGIYCDTIRCIHSKSIGIPLYKWTKIKQPLFTTEDGVDIYENALFYWINPLGSFQVNESKAKFDRVPNPSNPKFSTKEAAEEYVIMNKPCLSYNDITKFLDLDVLVKDGKEKLKELIKQK